MARRAGSVLSHCLSCWMVDASLGVCWKGWIGEDGRADWLVLWTVLLYKVARWCSRLGMLMVGSMLDEMCSRDLLVELCSDAFKVLGNGGR